MISKHNTTRFAPGGMGGVTRTAEPSSVSRSVPAADSVATQAPVLWAGVREALRRRVGDAKFDAWIARLDFIAEVNGEILLAASDDYQRSRVDTDFGHIIQQKQ